VLMSWDKFGRWYIEDVAICREEVGETDDFMAAVAEADGPDVTQVHEIDPAAAGKRDARTTANVLRSSGRTGRVVGVRAIQNKPAKVRPMANELRLGMVGDRPRRTADDAEPMTPRGFFLNANGWMTRPYKDGGKALATIGAIAREQIGGFFNPKLHDDIPDAAAIAHAFGTPQVVVKPKDYAGRARRFGL